MKLQLLTLIAFLFLTACDDSASTAEQGIASDIPVQEETSQEQTNEAAASTSGVPMETELYKISVLNDSIKSPRKEMKGQLAGVEVTVNYGSPAVKGRTVYGDLIPYGRVWRTGANEATRITFSEPVMLGKEKVPAGTYSLFTEPTDKTNWTVIVNKVAEQWGNYDYDQEQDVARLSVQGTVVEDKNEYLDFAVSPAGLEMYWDDLLVTIPVLPAS